MDSLTIECTFANSIEKPNVVIYFLGSTITLYLLYFKEFGSSKTHLSNKLKSEYLVVGRFSKIGFHSLRGTQILASISTKYLF